MAIVKYHAIIDAEFEEIKGRVLKVSRVNTPLLCTC